MFLTRGFLSSGTLPSHSYQQILQTRMSAPGLNKLNQLRIEVARLKSRSKHSIMPEQVKQQQQREKECESKAGQQQKQQKPEVKRSLVFELLQREREKQVRARIQPKIQFKNYLLQYRPSKISNQQRKRIFMTLKQLRRLEGRR